VPEIGGRRKRVVCRQHVRSFLGSFGRPVLSAADARRAIELRLCRRHKCVNRWLRLLVRLAPAASKVGRGAKHSKEDRGTKVIAAAGTGADAHCHRISFGRIRSGTRSLVVTHAGAGSRAFDLFVRDRRDHLPGWSCLRR
jgi:hypothetical protein